MIFLDTNIFLYAAGKSHPQRAPCAALLERAGRGEVEAVTSAEVVQEILHVWTRRGRRKDAVALARRVVLLFPNLLAVARADVALACDLLSRYQGLSVRDAVHAATMLQNKIQRIASVDPDFDVIREITRVPPAAL
jgi:hypothetical protein